MAKETWKSDKDEMDCEILKPTSPSSSSPASPPPLFLKPSQEISIRNSERTETEGTHLGVEARCSQKQEEDESTRTTRFINRCSSCKKRVGLTGFRCRCGDLFCSQHRYSDAHDCSFDYKAAGREEISKANPLIRAAKIIKI